MSACPSCGAEALGPVSEQYDREVRRPEPDLDLLAALAPPTRRASIHGFILAVLAWILLLIPFFASDRGRIRDTAAVAAAVLVWVFVFRAARRKDAALAAAYRARRRCAACGEEISGAGSGAA